RIGPTVEDGRVEVELRGHSAFSLAAEIAGLGAMVEVLAPAEVRDHLAAAGVELVAQYAGTALAVHEAVVVAARREDVWRAIVGAEARAGWWPYLDLDATPGGRMEERWTDGAGADVVTAGEVIEVIEPRLLRLTWKDDGWPAATEVELRLERQQGGTLVAVRHTGWDSLPDPRALVAAHRAGWRAHLEDLRTLFAG
ncbi:MAG TPA: SRPBCC domain-containing protein, partial [Acidimicrobiales bacterium]|nr:SRPBCC domain-containing protein [Acidimicrobiales bacterium]